MIRVLPILHPLCIIFALIVFYKAISGGVDIYYSIFRSVLVYSVCMILALVANNISLLVYKAAKEKASEENKNLILDTLQTLADNFSGSGSENKKDEPENE